MPDGLKQIDEASTLALIQAFKQAADDQNAAHNAVSGIASNLASGWNGNASSTYGQGLSAWMSGLNKVRHALQLIDDAIVTFARETDNTEDDNIAQAAYAMTAGRPSWT
jgi:WXG100 family type VII secretion target